jgi:GNAT superfamily N-acetyltransferase
MHERCSRATGYYRWLGPSPVFPKAYLRSLLAGTCEHIALVAISDGQPGNAVGLASAALTSDGWRELGLLVEDRYQAQGIGMLMLNTLVDLLDRDEDLCASVLFENHWLLAKLARFGAIVAHIDQGVIHARVSRTHAVAAHDIRRTRKAMPGEV